MSRLTKNDGNMVWALHNGVWCEPHELAIACDGTPTIAGLMRKLAAYEVAEEQGRLVVLPCKVGDVLYYNFQFSDKRILPFIRKAKVETISFRTKSMNISVEVELIDAKEKGIRRFLKIDDFGKTVFLTREEAEKALELWKKNET